LNLGHPKTTIMEDEAEFSADEHGHVSAKYLGWTIVDDALWALDATKILSLNISFNMLESLPPQIGRLQALRDLNCSCNHLRMLPPEIGQLTKMVRLKANGNHLLSLPFEIERCQELRELILSENKLESIPSNLSLCKHLKVLRLQHNCLQRLPIELTNIFLEEINVSRNPDLEMIPRDYRDDTEAILWILRRHTEINQTLVSMESEALELEDLYRRSSYQVESLCKTIDALEQERNELLRNTNAARHFVRFRELSNEFKQKFQDLTYS